MAETTSVLSLPLRLICRVLSQLEDVHDLSNVTLAHPFFYSALQASPTLISDTLKAGLGDDEVIMLALVAHEARVCRPRDKLALAAKYLTTYQWNVPLVQQRLSWINLAAATEIWDFHQRIEAVKAPYTSAVSDAYNDRQVFDANDATQRHWPIKNGAHLSTKSLYRNFIYCRLFAKLSNNSVVADAWRKLFFTTNGSPFSEELAITQHLAYLSDTDKVTKNESHLQKPVLRKGQVAADATSWQRRPTLRRMAMMNHRHSYHAVK